MPVTIDQHEPKAADLKVDLGFKFNVIFSNGCCALAVQHIKAPLMSDLVYLTQGHLVPPFYSLPLSESKVRGK
ncbi:MAG: hypothetical protein RLY17_1201 [Pseudomonadota bacterium]